MNKKDFTQYIKEHFPIITDVALLDEMYEVASFRKLDEGTLIMDFGNYIRSIPLVVDGSIKILREGENGGELLMYYLGGGDTCAMSLTCCMSQAKSEIRAVADSDVEMIMVPVEKMDEWMFKYRSWKNFVMQTYRARFEELLTTIDSIAFLKMDERLEQYLNQKFTQSETKELHITHQEIAMDLNTSREVISRLLKQLEKRGYITLGRNKILKYD